MPETGNASTTQRCRTGITKEWRSEYMKELLHDDDVREEGRAEGANQFVMLISRMNAGGDTDKVARLDEPEVLLAMRKKYGLE